MNNDYMFEDEDNMDFKSQESGQNQQYNANFAGEQYGQYTGPKYSYQDPGYKPESDGLGMAVVSMVLGVGSIMFFILGINIIGSIISIIFIWGIASAYLWYLFLELKKELKILFFQN